MRINGWWWVGGGCSVICLLGIFGTFWYTSDADWRRVQTEARTLGTATTWEEAGFIPQSAAEQTRMTGVISTGKLYPPLKDPLKIPRQIGSPTPELIAYHQSIPDTFWPQLFSEIASLPSEPGVLFERYALSTKLQIINDQRDLVRLLAERIRICPASDLPATIRAATRVCRLVQSQTLIQQLVDVSCIAIVSHAIGLRRDELRGSTMTEQVCLTLDDTAHGLWHARLSTWRGETVVLFTTYHDISNLSAYIPGPSSGKWWQIPIFTCKRALGSLVYRLNRARALRFAMTCESEIRRASDGRDLFIRVTSIPAPVPVFPKLTAWTEANPFPITGANHIITGGLTKALLQLALLRADLSDQPLPLDPFATPSAPLRPIERDGRTIGWYSVGPNGVDDGGVNGQDFGMPITESLGSKKFSDPPKNRP